MRPKYLTELDGVRGLAALMVMYFHFFTGIHSHPGAIIKFLVKTAVFGQTGVILFFVLSGFLITRILLSVKSSSHYFSNFYIRRSLRIFPLYYLALCIYLLASFTGAASTSITTWYYWPYLQNIAMSFKWDIQGPVHFWSLAVEEHFYLFWPVVIYFTSVKRLHFVIGSIVLCAIALRAILFYYGFEVFYFTGTTMDALAIGAILAVKEKNDRLSMYSRGFYLRCFSLAIVLLLMLWFFSTGKGLLIIQTFKGTFIALIYYLLILLLLDMRKNNLVKKILNQKVLQYTGKISYGLYVYHVLCFSVYSKFVKTSYLWLDFLNCFILSYVVASLSYYLFEARFLTLKERLAGNNNQFEQVSMLQPAG